MKTKTVKTKVSCFDFSEFWYYVIKMDNRFEILKILHLIILLDY